VLSSTRRSLNQLPYCYTFPCFGDVDFLEGAEEVFGIGGFCGRSGELNGLVVRGFASGSFGSVIVFFH